MAKKDKPPKHLLLFFNTSFTNIESLDIECPIIAFDCPIFSVSLIVECNCLNCLNRVYGGGTAIAFQILVVSITVSRSLYFLGFG